MSDILSVVFPVLPFVGAAQTGKEASCDHQRLSLLTLYQGCLLDTCQMRSSMISSIMRHVEASGANFLRLFSLPVEGHGKCVDMPEPIFSVFFSQAACQSAHAPTGRVREYNAAPYTES